MSIPLKYNIVIVLLLILTISKTFAINTNISGSAKGAENLEIRFYYWDDYVTYKEVLLQKSKIDEKGNFQFNVNMQKNEVIYGFFRIMNFSSSNIFICSGKSYNIAFDTFDYKDPNRIYIPFLSKIELKYQINTADSSDLNNLIAEFNYEYNKFLVNTLKISPEKQNKTLDRVPKSKVDSFATACENNFAKYNNDYFDSYRKYTYAEMHTFLNSMSQKKIFDQYIFNQPVLLDNIQYMNFFSQFFEDYILSKSREINNRSIIENVNKKTNITALIDSLGADTFLRNEVIREAVLITNINEWYTSGLNQKNLINLLRTYSASTKFDLIAKIADNIVEIYTRYSPDKKITNFKFFNHNGDEICNDSLTLIPTYMLFFTTWSKPCLSELNALNKIAEQWKDSLRIIGVCMDVEPLKLYYFEQDNKFSFPLYHFNNNYVFAEEMSLQSYPQGILIDDKAHYIKHIAPLPSEGLNTFLTKTFVPSKAKEIEIGN